MLSKHNFRRGRIGGFTLIEMMVAIVIGLIVIAGAVTLIVAINRANSATIQGTRIDQELRALAGTISDEIKRSRRRHDPLCYVGGGSTSCLATSAAEVAMDTVDTSTAGCVVYGYQDPTLNDPTLTAAAVYNYRAISLQSGSVVFASGTAAVTCATTGTALSSPQINITGLTFTCPSGTGKSCSEIDLTLTGTLKAGDAVTKLSTNSYTQPHTYTQPIFIRSGAVKTS
jgi:type IV pilus assembly protein PilW